MASIDEHVKKQERKNHANRLDSEQGLHSVGPDLDSNCLTQSFPEIIFWKG